MSLNVFIAERRVSPPFTNLLQSHRLRPIHIEGRSLPAQRQQLPFQLDLDGLVVQEVHRLLGRQACMRPAHCQCR